RPDIQADNVEETETRAVRETNERTSDRIDFFHRIFAFDGDFADSAAEKAADAVGDEIRRVLAGNNAFAQTFIGEGRDEFENRRIRFGAGDDLEEMQISRGIEKVRA